MVAGSVICTFVFTEFVRFGFTRVNVGGLFVLVQPVISMLFSKKERSIKLWIKDLFICHGYFLSLWIKMKIRFYQRNSIILKPRISISPIMAFVFLGAFVLLAACEPATMSPSTAMNNPVVNPAIAEPSGSQMRAEASGRKRIRDLRAEVLGNIAYLKTHLGEDRAHILDMRDSLLVSIQGRGVFEDNGNSRMTLRGIDAVARIAASMIAYPHTRITIAGHVTGTTSATRDQILSERRAVAVKSVLMSRGIDQCRIGVLGKGSDDHVATPVTERRNQYNDRIEILMKPYQDGACV